MQLTDFKLTDYSPEIKGYDNILKQIVLKHTLIEFTVKNCSSAAANVFRRIPGGELALKYMTSEYEQLETNDEFIIPEMILERVKMIPVLQTVPGTVKFHLNESNDSPVVKTIFTSSLRASDSKIYFDQNIPLVDLKSGRAIKLESTVGTAYTYEQGMVSAVSQVSSTAVGVDIINELESPDGQKSSNSDPRVHKISMISNGMMEPKAIIKATCDTIISRLETIKSALSELTGVNSEYVLTIMGESDTIGNLLMKEAWDRYPSMNYMTYQIPPDIRQLTIRISAEDPKSILKDTINECVQGFKSVKASL